MSVATISYGSLKDSSNEAKGVAKKLRDYSTSLNKCVYTKFDSYSGSVTANISSAKSAVKQKMDKLEKRAFAYDTYAQDLIQLRDDCKTVDNEVKELISNLGTSFKKTRGFSGKAQTAINFLLNKLTEIKYARWLTNKIDGIKSKIKYGKDKLKRWWNYDGGKELIGDLISVVATITIDVCTIIAEGGVILAALGVTAETGGAAAPVGVAALVQAIAAVTGSVLSIGDEIVHLTNGIRAYIETADDPAKAKKIREIDSIFDALLSTDKKWCHGLGYTIKTVQVVCDIVGLVGTLKQLGTKGIKWATDSQRPLDDIDIRDVLKRDTWNDFSDKFVRTIRTNFDNIRIDFDDIKTAARAKNWDFFKNGARDFLRETKIKIKDDYFDFDGIEAFKSSFENIVGVVEPVLTGETDLKTVIDTYVLPNIKIDGLDELDVEFRDFISEFIDTLPFSIGEDEPEEIFRNTNGTSEGDTSDSESENPEEEIDLSSPAYVGG